MDRRQQADILPAVQLLFVHQGSLVRPVLSQSGQMLTEKVQGFIIIIILAEGLLDSRPLLEQQEFWEGPLFSLRWGTTCPLTRTGEPGYSNSAFIITWIDHCNPFY